MDWNIDNNILTQSSNVWYYAIPLVITIWTTRRWFPHSYYYYHCMLRMRTDDHHPTNGTTNDTSKEPRDANDTESLSCQHNLAEEEKAIKLQRQQEKESFLLRAGAHYGYASSPMGHIDTWRCRELPGLHHSNDHDKEDPEENKEIYLDYAGSALPWQSQLQAAAASPLLANPHSHVGPTASRTLQQMDIVRQQLLELWDATPGVLAGFPQRHATTATDYHEHPYHPGYHLFFTSGTTEALRLVAEQFVFTPNVSLFACPAASHTSVLGMRECALRAGASFRVWSQPEEMSDILRHTDQVAPSSQSKAQTSSNLVVLPLECNFTGDRLSPHVYQAFRSQQTWCVGLDMAKAACTGPVSLKEWDPDFAVVSFYKLFGAPTGLGALLVKKNSSLAAMLLSPAPQQHAYFGGGTVQVVVPARDYVVRHTTETSIRGGTSHFRGICELKYGLETLQKLGGMPAIQNHTNALARELVRRLCLLKHASTGQPAIVLYGAWAYKPSREDGNGDHPGPTVTFNVLRDDGKTYVGYHEIAQLAALHSPPIQFRVGCFCNPGGCQQALGWSDDEIISNFEQLGHVCGDDVDLIDGKPTGAVRISVGKDSTWEDIDGLVRFLDRVYVQQNEYRHKEPHCINDRNEKQTLEMRLTELYIFPIKSCAAQRVDRWPVVQGQLWMDRSFCLVNASGQALRLSTHSKMARICPSVSLETNEMNVTAPGMDPLVVPLLLHGDDDDDDDHKGNTVRVCGSHECNGIVWGDTTAARWFSTYLGVSCWLARHSATSTKTANVSSFANEQPILMIRQNAVDAINVILQRQGKPPVSSRHFRPNFVVQVNGDHDDDDDECQHVLYNQTICWQIIGPCARCNMVDLDPTSGTKGGHTLRALAEYHQNHYHQQQRRFRGPLTFGSFLQQVEEEHHKEPIWMQVGEIFSETMVS